MRIKMFNTNKKSSSDQKIVIKLFYFFKIRMQCCGCTLVLPHITNSNVYSNQTLTYKERYYCLFCQYEDIAFI